MAQQKKKALAIAQHAVKTRETWYNEAEFQPPYMQADDSWVVWVVRPAPRGHEHPGMVIYIMIDKNGSITRYRHGPIWDRKAGDMRKASGACQTTGALAVQVPVPVSMMPVPKLTERTGS